MVREWAKNEYLPVTYIIVSVIFFVALVLGIPLLFLIAVQMKNLLLAKTTY